jgi:hypothetical protein
MFCRVERGYSAAMQLLLPIEQRCMRQLLLLVQIAHRDADSQSKQQYTGIKAQHNDNAAFFSPINNICGIF